MPQVNAVKQVGGTYNPQSQGSFTGPQLQPTVTAPRLQPAVAPPVAPAKQPLSTTKTFYRNDGDPTVYDNTGHAYSSPAEFFAAGGSWAKVVVRPSIKPAAVASNGFPAALKVVSQPANQGVITKTIGAAPYPPSKSMVFGIGENLSKEDALNAFRVTGTSPIPLTDAQKNAEAIKLFSETPTSQLLKKQFGDNPFTKTLGFVMDQVEPITRDISNIHLVSTKISQGVANGTIDPSVFDGVEVLHKTVPQIVGDVASAVLTAYTPSIGVGLLKESAGKELLTQGLKELAIQGGKEGLAAGLQFGVAQALSSGSTNPDEITKIILANAAIGTATGAILHTTIPAISKVIAANNQIKEDIINQYLKMGLSHEEAVRQMKLDSQGGFLKLFDTPKESAAKEAVSNLQQQYERELNKDKPNKTVISRLKKAISQAEISRDKIIFAEKQAGHARLFTPLGEDKPKPNKYPTIHENGVMKIVDGEPIKIVDGVETFVHKDENGNWVVSESTTGRNVTGGGFANKDLAIKNARANIDNVGADRFKQLVAEKQLPQTKTEVGNQKVSEPLPSQIPIIERSAIGSKERGFITSVKEAGVKVEGTTRITTRNTEELAIKARNLVKENIGAAEKMATGTSDKAVATTSELIKYYDNLSKIAKTDAERNLALDKISVIANETAKNLTDAGRTVQAASILNMQTPEGQLRFASRLIQKYNDLVDKKGGGILGLRKKIPELTGQQAQDILNESKKVFAMPEGEAKAVAFQKLQNKISALIPSKNYDKVISVWKAGLLTGLKTTGTNISANISHGLSEVIKDVPAAIVDKITSMFTGKRTLALTGKGSATGIAEGWKKGLRYMRTGYDERNLAQKLDYNKVNFTSRGGKILQKYEDGVFRLLGAEDQPFYYGAKARSLYSQAIAEAKNAGVKGAERLKFVDNLVQNPTEDMLKYAVHDAEIAVFQNQTALGRVAKGIQNIPGGEVVVPFGRTPAAVATQIVNYSPVGIVKTIVENIGKGKFDQRLFAQGIGRGITGTGALYIGMELFKHGNISLGYPSNEREKRLWELEGRKPNSIKINGKWRSIAVLGPVGNVLVVGGYLQQGLDDTGSFASALASAGTGAAKSLTEQTFLQGLNSFTQAINDPAGYGPSLLGNLIGSAVPTIVSDVAQATDPLQRRTSATKDGLLTPLQARVPYFRNKLEPKINALGQPVKRVGNPIETLLDPTRPSRINDGPIIKELRRLHDTGNLAAPTYFADDKKLQLSAQQKNRLAAECWLYIRAKSAWLDGY
jgi:hypothetical protein